MPKKAPKTEPVAPSQPPGTLENLLVETSRVRQFLGGPPTKNGPVAQKCSQTTPTGSCFSKSRHFCGAKGKESAKNGAGGPKLPPWEFGKSACCTMVPKHPDTLKTPTLSYVHTRLPPKYYPNMCMHVMGGCEAGKAQRKNENGPGNCPGPLLFLKFLIIPGQISMRYFWTAVFGAVWLGRAQVVSGRGRRFDSRAPQALRNWRRRHFFAKNPAPAGLSADKPLSAEKHISADNTCLARASFERPFY